MTVGGRSANRGSGYQMEMSEDQGYVTWGGGGGREKLQTGGVDMRPKGMKIKSM